MTQPSGEPFSRVSSGVSGLDDVLHGGLPEHRIYLIEGDPGTGKTTLAMQFMLRGLRDGGRGLYVTLSETEDELRIMADAHGWDISSLLIFECVPVEANLSPDNQYTFFHPEEIELGETIQTILTRVEEAQPTHLVIDALTELRLLAQDARRYRRQVLALKHYFAKKKTTVFMLDDRTSLTQEKQLHSVVHGVLSLERIPRDYGRNRRRIEITKVRGSSYLDGYHDYQIHRGGLTVYPRLLASQHHTDFTRSMISCNVRNLDDLLGGGLDRGSASLFVGPPGSGKTTLAIKYATAAIDRGEPVSMYTFDEGLGTLFARSEGLGIPISRHMKEGKMELHQVDPAEMSPDEFAWSVRQSVERNGAKFVVIDSLNGYLNAMPEEQFLNLQMHELLTYLNQRGVVTILVLAQQGPLGQHSTAVDLSYLADTIVLLRFFEFQGEIRRAISVIKKRATTHEQSIREFRIGGTGGVEVGDPLTQFHGVLTGIPQFTGDLGHLFGE